MEILTKIISYNKSPRNQKPKYIVIHSTGNTNDTALNNWNYFNGGNRGASADWFVDDINAIQVVDTDYYYSWAVGDGHGKYGISNSNSLSIEMCGTDNGNISETTMNNTIELVKKLQSKYGIDNNQVVRHYDASRKSCPYQFMNNNWSRWNDFKNRLENNNTTTNTWKQGWNKNSTGWWYCTDKEKQYYYKDVWKEIDGQWYSFDNQGYARCNCWLQDGGKWYWLKDNCMMAKNEWLHIDGKEYQFDEHGAMVEK